MNSVNPDKYGSPVRYGPEMRVLIVGGGAAGLTMTALLQQRGFNPTLVERIPEYGNVGYIIVIWPSGSRILKGLGVYERLLEVGFPFSAYNVWNEKGEKLHSYSVLPVIEKYGPMISVYRPELINVLREAVDPESIRMNTTVTRMEQTNDEVFVKFSDGREDVFDLVIGCDGVRSQTRRAILGDTPLTYSGMSGWSFWLDPELSLPNQSNHIVEYWGTGKFFGIWPTKGRLSVFTCIKVPEGIPDPPEERIDRLKSLFGDFCGAVPEILDSLRNPEEIFHSDYYDLRMDRWYDGRVVLCGDAAHAILPTAGGGVSMSMESAAVLTDELCRTDSKYITHAFDNYISRRRARVNKVQDQSRMVGKVAYVNSRIVSSIRNYIFKLYSDKFHMKYWDSILKEPI